MRNDGTIGIFYVIHVLESAARIVLFCSIFLAWGVAMDPLPVTNTKEKAFCFLK